MNKLKEINGKYYQECEVVMLAVDKKATDKPFTTGITLCNDDNLRIGNPVGKSESRQELYFLSNEKIKEGDWCIRINPDSSIIGLPFKADHIIVLSQSHKGYKKIIATTDTSLTIIDYVDCEYPLPQPSKEFIQAYIKAYNEGNPITKVLVEYEEVQTACFHNIPTQDINQLEDCWELVPKVNSSNEITIKKIKNSYTREEYSKGLKDAIERAIQYPELFITGICCDDSKINNWIEHNL
ncbi:hypothetical protein M0Q97_02820 [Candidatus Dojkabacteria bacterium]|jgi:hypothetical protein|nr:hypothetical protein [Candidatus Dojkabacteria bacterium]